MMKFKPIGVIQTPFQTKEGMPIQPSSADGVKGRVTVNEEYEEGLADLGGFSHVYLIYHLHKSEGYNLKVIPFLDNVLRGLFATRAPRRPNAIGLSVVKLIKVEVNTLEIENVDMLNGTPLLDIKPYVPEFNGNEEIRIGWLKDKSREIPGKKSDKRFDEY